MTAKQFLVDIDLNGAGRVIGLLDPTSAQHAATKAYVDSAVEGLAWKDSARVASTSNITIASPGATIDGVTMVANDRVLVKNQTTGSENGLYIWNAAATPLTRSLDADTAAELEQAVVTVEEGTSAGATFRQTTVNFTLGSGTVTWTSFGTSAAAATETTAGIAEIATQAETDAGTDDARIVTPLKLATYSGRAKRYATDIGDGSSTSYTVTHSLGTRDVVISVYRNSGNRDEIGFYVEHTSTSAVTLIFNTAPTSNQFRVVVLA